MPTLKIILPSALLSVLCLSVLCGCGEKDLLNRQEINGTVSIAGQPAASGFIEFVSPEFMSGAPIAEGKFLIKKELGIPPGEYLIRISVPDLKAPRVSQNNAPGEIKLAKEMVPDEYNQKSQEKRTVEAGKVNKFTFEIPHARK